MNDGCKVFEFSGGHIQENGIIRDDDGMIIGRIEEWRDQIEQLTLEVSNWTETAALNQRNTDFYRGIVIEIGELFGVAAKTSDDGSVQEDVLALKVPELVRSLLDA